MEVGGRIKAIRTSRGLTVAALADKTGLSKGLISQIENDKASPSLATLERLAEGLGVPAAYLLLKTAEGLQVVRAGDRPLYHFGLDRLRVEALSVGSGRSLNDVLVEMPPATATGSEAHAHGGEEFHLVLEGRVQAVQGDQQVVLEAGDAFHWTGCVPHRVINVGTGTARILAVTSASLLDVLGEESEG